MKSFRRKIRGRSQSKCFLASRGFTAIEVLVSAVILGLIMLPIVSFIKSVAKDAGFAGFRLTTQQRLRGAMVDIERDLSIINQFTVASSTEVQGYLDSDQRTSYNRNGDFDLDNIPNQRDPDDDNDRVVLATAASVAWMVGDDLNDDDDDNDRKRDVLFRYRLINDQLVRDYQYNESSWTNERILLVGISSFTISYFGSINMWQGPGWDTGTDTILGNEPVAAGDTDSILTETELRLHHGVKWVDFITNVRVQLNHDSNRDGEPESRIDTYIIPPLIPIKEKY